MPEQIWKRLQCFKVQRGVISSPSDGVIKSLSVQTGDLTGQTAAVVLYSADGALRMTGTISKEDIKYVSAGADVKITDNNNNDISGATVEKYNRK